MHSFDALKKLSERTGGSVIRSQRGRWYLIKHIRGEKFMVFYAPASRQYEIRFKNPDYPGALTWAKLRNASAVVKYFKNTT